MMKTSALQRMGRVAALAIAGLFVSTGGARAATANCSIQCYSAAGDFADVSVTLEGVPGDFSCSEFAYEMSVATELTCYGSGFVLQ